MVFVLLWMIDCHQFTGPWLLIVKERILDKWCFMQCAITYELHCRQAQFWHNVQCIGSGVQWRRIRHDADDPRCHAAWYVCA